MKKIVTLTMNPAIDKSTNAENVLAEIKIRCDVPIFEPGGGGINVSRAIRNLEGDSLAVYTSGGGPGQMMDTLLSDEGITQQPVAIADYTRENLIVYETTSGVQYRFGLPGPELTEDEWQRCIDATLTAEADFIVASGSLPRNVPDDFYAQLCRRVHESDRDCKVIVDTSGDALAAMPGAGAYLMKPNLRELGLLAGHEFQGEDDIRMMAQDLIRGGLAEVLVVSMGASGAVLITADVFVQMRPPVVPIQSKVGAGDSMVGGIVLALARGETLRDAARYGIAAGSAAVMTPGTQLCRKEDVDAIFPRVAVLDS